MLTPTFGMRLDMTSVRLQSAPCDSGQTIIVRDHDNAIPMSRFISRIKAKTSCPDRQSRFPCRLVSYDNPWCAG
jgi:hypothetical protein